jgi:RNA polymerase sigma factor (sigma-70 family)
MTNSGPAEVLRQTHALFAGLGSAAGLSDRQLLERFADRRGGGEAAEDAFRAIVERHAPMVWGVCRRHLADRHEAEDAFQAVWIVLARKGRSRSIRVEDSLGRWLYGVSRRVAGRARVVAGRRRRLEGAGPVDAFATAGDDAGRVELRGVIDDELARLPEAFRAPLALCYLEGLTHEEAASRLRCPVGTVRSRLARGRDRLRDRLARRGVAATAAAVAAEALRPDPDPAATVARAASTAPGRTTEVATAAAQRLAGEVIRAMTMNRTWKAAALAAGVVGAALAATLGLARGRADDEGAASSVQADRDNEARAQEPKKSEETPKTPEAEAPGRTLDLRVVEAKTGRPIPGAKAQLYLSGPSNYAADDRGHCRIPLPADMPEWEGFYIGVWKDGYTPIRINSSGRILKEGGLRHYTVELDPALPMGGIVQDERGRPIAGAEVKLVFFRAIVRRSGDSSKSTGYETINFDGYETFVTDARGHWECRLLPETLSDGDYVSIRLSHPDYASDVFEPQNPRPSIRSLREKAATLTMREGVPVEGRVLDRHGAPVAGAKVALVWDKKSTGEAYKTTTDAEGHYRFPHARPVAQAVLIQAEVFAPALTEFEPRPGASLEARLEPARTIRGRAVDEKGRPVAGASVRADSWRSYQGPFDWEGKTDAEGRFAWAGAPADAVTLAVRREWRDTGVKVEAPADAGELAVTLSSRLRVRGTVVDAETGRPIERFRALPGIIGYPGVEPQGRPQWQQGDAAVGQGGRYELTFDNYAALFSFSVRVEAEGYLPAESRAYKADEADQVFDVELQPGPGVEGVVKYPDGGPADGAEVILVTQTLVISDGQINESSQFPRLRTGADGRFWFAKPGGPFALVVMDPKGVAVVHEDEFRPGRDVTLRPWGRVEGTIRVPGAAGRLPVFGTADRSGPLYLFFTNEGRVEASGRFVVDRLPPGEVRVGLGFPMGQGENIWTHLTLTEVEPGGTATATVGGTGRAVVGHLTLADGAVPLIDFAKGQGLLSVEQPAPTPEGFATWERGRQAAWWAEFRKSDAGRAYSRDENRYGVSLAADGAFRVEDVPPGRYQLAVSIEQPRDDPSDAGVRKDVATVRREVVVPEGPREEPFDLGAVEIAIREYRSLNVGDVVPDFEVETLEGKTLKLSDFRGKFVLLDFWATWCGPCLAQTPHLKAAFDRFGMDERFAVIGLSLDEDRDAPRRYAESKGLAWAQGFLGQDPPSPVPGAFGVRSIPRILLIGPDGKLVADHLSGEQIVEKVAEALGRE